MYLQGTTNIPYDLTLKNLPHPTATRRQWRRRKQESPGNDLSLFIEKHTVTPITLQQLHRWPISCNFATLLLPALREVDTTRRLLLFFLAFLALLWELCVVHWFLLPTFFPPTGFPNTSPNILKLPPGHFAFYYVISLKKSVLNGFVHWGEKAYVHLSTNLRIPCIFLILCPFSSNRFHTSTSWRYRWSTKG